MLEAYDKTDSWSLQFLPRVPPSDFLGKSVAQFRGCAGVCLVAGFPPSFSV